VGHIEPGLGAVVHSSVTFQILYCPRDQC
jgi:hypothetical protein